MPSSASMSAATFSSKSQWNFSESGHLQHSFRKTGSFEFQLGSCFIDLLEVVPGEFDVHCAEVFPEPMQMETNSVGCQIGKCPKGIRVKTGCSFFQWRRGTGLVCKPVPVPLIQPFPNKG